MMTKSVTVKAGAVTWDIVASGSGTAAERAADAVLRLASITPR